MGAAGHLTQAFLHPLPSGDEGIRTPDPLLAGQVLSQLSYTPMCGSRFRFIGIRNPDLAFRRRIRQDSQALAGFRSDPLSLYASAVLIPTELHPHVRGSSFL